MMIFKKAIPRRTFLRGMGAAMALPLLDGMIPAFAKAVATPRRWAIINVPNGMILDAWIPEKEGPDFELSPILKPLAPFRDCVLVVSGLANNTGNKREGEVGGDHPRGSTTYLTCVHPRETSGADIRAGISIDQVIAQKIGKETALESLELGLEPHDILGGCEANYSCAYYNTIAWRDPQTPLQTENNPRVIFEHLFGAGDNADPAERQTRIRENRSVLDFVSESTSQLLRKLGPSDSAKFNQYLDSVREVERGIQVAEHKASSPDAISLSRPAGIPATMEEHIHLLFDLLALAFQTDTTRVSSFMYGHEMGALSYPQIGFPDAFHALTHHQGNRKMIGQCVEIETYNTRLFTYLIEKLQKTPDGDGSLLDHTLVQFGSSLGDGNLHTHYDIPTVLVGGPGLIQGGRHLRLLVETYVPLANMYVTIANKMGVPLENFGDSNGKLEL